MAKRNQSFENQYGKEVRISSELCLPPKTHIFHCACGEDILIVPSIRAVNAALKNHLTRHPGQFLTEQLLVKETLRQITNGVSDLISLTE